MDGEVVKALTLSPGGVHAQASHKSWMNDSWEKLEGEVVEREVANAYKVRNPRARAAQP